MFRDGAWHKPQYHVAPFYPATPDGWLVKGIKQIVREEAGRVGLRIKVVEESGTSLGSLLTRPDLSGCLLPDCRMSEVVTTGERPLTRQLSEAQRIANDMASGQLINGRNEHIALAFQQLAPVDILNRHRGRGTGQ